jgi:hypothetical protein
MKNGRLSTPTTPEATREMKTPFNCANHLCQKCRIRGAAGVRVSRRFRIHQQVNLLGVTLPSCSSVP